MLDALVKDVEILLGLLEHHRCLVACVAPEEEAEVAELSS